MNVFSMRSGSVGVPIETRKPDTKFREAEAKAGCKQYYKAEGIKNSI